MDHQDARRHVLFWLGVLVTTAGVALHLPMFISARHMNFVMAGMTPNPTMIIGMGAVVVGIPITAYGLMPPRASHRRTATKLRVRALDDAPLGALHIRLLLVMAVAVTIDVMKPATLAFVVPGMADEYGLRSPSNPSGDLPVSLLPLVGIVGTVLGSFLWGWLGDRIGRRSSILLAGVIFIATSVCGCMPTFTMNLVMCFIMGVGAGGMLPIAFTLLSETIPARHRGALLVLIGGDVAGAYFITSWLSAALGPIFGWRILWLVGLPTGILLIILTRWIPESPRYLLAMGRDAEARQVLHDFNAVAIPIDESELGSEKHIDRRYRQLLRQPLTGLTLMVALVGLGSGLVLFGFKMWLPSNLRELGFTAASADRIVRDAALAGLPLNFLIAYLYHRTSRWTLISLSGTVVVSLGALVAAGEGLTSNNALLFALLVVPLWGGGAIVAVSASYCAEAYPTLIRSRGSGLATGTSKAGGVLVIGLVVASVAAPSIQAMALLGAVPLAAAAVIALFVATETSRRQLEDITRQRLDQGSPHEGQTATHAGR